MIVQWHVCKQACVREDWIAERIHLEICPPCISNVFISDRSVGSAICGVYVPAALGTRIGVEGREEVVDAIVNVAVMCRVFANAMSLSRAILRRRRGRYFVLLISSCGRMRRVVWWIYRRDVAGTFRSMFLAIFDSVHVEYDCRKNEYSDVYLEDEV